MPDLSLRSTCDVDLVTLPEHVLTVEQHLFKCGYVASDDQDSFIRHHHHRVYFKPGEIDSTTIELHWTFLYKTFGREDYDRVIMSRTQQRRDKIRCLDPHDFLLSLLLHLAQHRFRGQLKWVVDIAVASAHPAIDMRTLLARARAFGVLSAVQYGLWLTNHLLGEPTPAKLDRKITALSTLNPPLELLRDPREPEAWKRPIIDILLHDKVHRGVARALYRSTKVLENKFSLRLPNWMILNKH